VGYNSICNGSDSTGRRVVDECAAVDVGLLEVEVELLALVAGVGRKVGEDLGLEAAREGVVELNLGRKEVGGVPRLGDADSCAVCRQLTDAYAYASSCKPVAGWLDCMKYIRRQRPRRMDGYD
jgi:hypothetical protein